MGGLYSLAVWIEGRQKKEGGFDAGMNIVPG
jgi:hypothetical protein